MLVLMKKISGFHILTSIGAIILFSGALSAYGQVVLVKGNDANAGKNAKSKPKAKAAPVRTRGIDLGTTPVRTRGIDLGTAPVRTRGIDLGTGSKTASGVAETKTQVKTRGIDLGNNAALLPKQMQFPVASPITASKPVAAAAKPADKPVAPAVPAAKPATKAAAAPGVFTISMPKMGSDAAAEPNKEEKKSAPVENVAAKAKEAEPKPAAPAAPTVAAPPVTDTVVKSAAAVPAPPKFALPVLPPPKLSTFGFDVMTTDERGRMMGKRVETARYFQVELPGGMQMDLVQVPTGGFMMGTLESDLVAVKQGSSRGVEKKDLNYDIVESYIRRVNWESPRHMVNVPGFYMSKFEITQAQWRAVASLPRVNTDLLSDPSSFKGSNLPVETITWDEAIEFCERLTRATGRRFRLPTEAEWEYAARAGTNTPFNFGDSIKTDWANFQGKFPYNNSPKGEFRETTVAVGTLGLPNAFGLYDMHGNVWEWCSDVWNENYEGAPVDGKSWDTGKISYLRIIRGGAWDSFGGECRSNSRNRMTATIRLNSIGLRVVADIPEGASPIQANLQ
jgi:formylglycine-generating enzyme required for sulfatase activity